MRSTAVPTIRIASEAAPGGVVINLDDFDAAKHVEFGKAPSPAADAPAKASTKAAKAP